MTQRFIYDLGLIGNKEDKIAGLNADRRGDLLVGLGKIEEARQAYKSALELLGDASPLYRIVKIKADSLDGNGS